MKLLTKILATVFVLGVLVGCTKSAKDEQAKAPAAEQKVTLLLDWFVNPNHAPIVIAQQKGYFANNGLSVEIVEPADPSLPPKLVAAGKADIAVDYQPQLQQQVAEGLPLVRIGTLISSPLNSLVVLKDSNIKQIADLKGKKIGYSVSGFEELLLLTMLQSAGLSKQDVEMINVNWSLSPSLLSGQTHAVIGAFRNFELNQLKIEKREGLAFFPEQHGIPAYDELIFVANKAQLSESKLKAFLEAVSQANEYIQQNPQQAWQDFVSYKAKELDNELNKMAWQDTLAHFAKDPKALDVQRYEEMAKFMQDKGLIKQLPAVSEYAVELK